MSSREDILNKLRLLGEINDYSCASGYNILNKYNGNKKELKIPDLFNEIASWAFYKNNDLEYLKTNKRLLRIQNYVFMNCKMLSTIILNEELRQISDGAFTGCNISEIVIPKKVVSLGYGSLAVCPLDDVYIKSTSLDLSMVKEALNLACIGYEQVRVHFPKERGKEDKRRHGGNNI